MSEWIQTYTGKRFDLGTPRPCDVDIRDIAHHLSNICRFTGATHSFYSVAQHSVIVSRLVDPQNALAALLHDAHEAYTNDLTRPHKRLLSSLAVLDAERGVERNIQHAIWERFGIVLDSHAADEIHRADDVALATEVRDLMGGDVDGWCASARLPPPLPERIIPWSTPESARLQFKTRFAALVAPRRCGRLVAALDGMIERWGGNS